MEFTTMDAVTLGLVGLGAFGLWLTWGDESPLRVHERSCTLGIDAVLAAKGRRRMTLDVEARKARHWKPGDVIHVRNGGTYPGTRHKVLWIERQHSCGDYTVVLGAEVIS